MSAQAVESRAPQPGDQLVLTATIRKITCNGRIAIVQTGGGEVWVPIAFGAQLPDPGVVVTPSERPAAPEQHKGCRACGR